MMETAVPVSGPVPSLTAQSAGALEAAWSLEQMFTSPALVAVIGLALTAVYCLLALRSLAAGWEPRMGRPVSRPMGLSAATLRWVRAGRFDTASLTAGLLTLAAKEAMTVEQDPRHVRINKEAHATRPMSIAEAFFAEGLLRMCSSILFNANAAPQLQRGAAALQDGIDIEWRGYQAGRVGHLFLPGILIGGLTIVLAAALSSTPIWVGARAALAALALVLGIRFWGRIRAGLARLWWEPAHQAARLAFDVTALLAAFGTMWVILTYQGGRPDPAATVFGALALALPIVVRRYAIASRRFAGPLRGRIEALRNQLLSRARGIDAIVFADPKETHRPDRHDEDTVRVIGGGEPLYEWLPDAVALDAVTAPPSAPIAELSFAFEQPERLGAVLRMAAQAGPPRQDDEPAKALPNAAEAGR